MYQFGVKFYIYIYIHTHTYTYIHTRGYKLYMCVCVCIIYIWNKFNTLSWGFPGCSVVKIPHVNTRDMDLIPGLGRSTGGGNGNPLQHFRLENPMDRGAWWATVHVVTKSEPDWTHARAHTHTHTHTHTYYTEITNRVRPTSEAPQYQN